MQQTSKYQFKLIEGADDFSPTPLNDNMERVEEELSELNDTVATLMETVDGHKMAVGSYKGNDGTRTINVGFTPAVVLVVNQQIDGSDNGKVALVIAGKNAFEQYASTTMMSIVDNGFQVHDGTNASLSSSYYTYIYLALL